jgi:hypothetical protein
MLASLSLILAALFDGLNPVLVSLLPAVGLALIAVGILSSVRARRRRAAHRLTAREQVERLRQKDAVRGDLEHLMVEIEQLAKRMGAQLDAKTIEIEMLIRRADERLAELRRLTEQGAPPPQAELPGAPPMPAEPASDPLSRRVCELADEGLSPVEIARQLDEHVGKVELILALRKA